jgi:gas vesicle protein
MKASTKIGIGLSVAAVASVSVAVMASEKLIKKMAHATNRHKVKKFVNDKFDGNEKLMTVVDDLSDEELDSVMNILGKVKDSRQVLANYGEKVKDNTESMKDRLFSFVEDMMN